MSAELHATGVTGARPHERVLRLREVAARTGLSRSSIYVYMARGHFPRRIRIGLRATGWLNSEIDEWISARAEAARRTT